MTEVLLFQVLVGNLPFLVLVQAASSEDSTSDPSQTVESVLPQEEWLLEPDAVAPIEDGSIVTTGFFFGAGTHTSSYFTMKFP